MKIRNQSRKIIAINGVPLLPGMDVELPERFDKHPSIQDYFKKGVIADANAVVASSVSDNISDREKARIAEEAIAAYKATQEAAEAAKAKKAAEIKLVKVMKKDELVTKAIGMGLEVSDSDNADLLKEKIIAVLSE